MEKVKYYRKVKCETCGSNLFSVYIRKEKKFKSLEGFYYCENCLKVFQLQLNNDKPKTIKRGVSI